MHVSRRRLVPVFSPKVNAQSTVAQTTNAQREKPASTASAKSIHHRFAAQTVIVDKAKPASTVSAQRKVETAVGSRD